MNWFYAEAGKQVGPIAEADFQNLVTAGTVRADTLVWREGMAEWQPHGQVSHAQSVASGAPTSAVGGTVVACAECGKVVSPDEAIRFGEVWVCAACKPVFVQKLKEGGTLAGVLEYAGFGIRFGAKFLDGIIMNIVSVVVRLAVGFPMLSNSGMTGSSAMIRLAVVFVIQYSLHAAYDTFFVGKFGATPGKMACKLRVVMPDGSPVTYWRAFGRHFAEILSALTLMIGYLMAAFDKEEHRALHDRICNTRVIKIG